MENVSSERATCDISERSCKDFIIQFAFFVISPSRHPLLFPRGPGATARVRRARADRRLGPGGQPLAGRRLRGLGAPRDCLIQQGDGYARCREAVLWINRAEATEQRPNKVIAYLEGDVEVAADRARSEADDRSNVAGPLRQQRRRASQSREDGRQAGRDAADLYGAGMERRQPRLVRPPTPTSSSAVRQAQFNSVADHFRRAGAPSCAPTPHSRPAAPMTADPPARAGSRAADSVYPRSNVPMQAKIFRPIRAATSGSR